MATATTASEFDILFEVISANDEGTLSPEMAEIILRWKFPKRHEQRMNKLAKLNGQGKLKPAEREEIERYIKIGNFVNIAQAKARLALMRAEASKA